MRRYLLLAGIVLAFSAQHAKAELLSFYEFDTVNEAAPGVILDSSGKGNHGVIRVLDGAVGSPSILDGGTGFSGGASDRSVSLESNGDIYLPTVNNGPDPGAFDSIIENQEITISFWVKPPAADNHQDTFWGWLNPGRSSSIAPWSNNNIFWDTGGCCGGTQRLNGAIDPPDGEWHHWAFTRNEFGDKIIYFDGDFLYEGIEQNAELLGPDVDAPQEYAIGSELTAEDPVRYATAEFDDYAVFDEFLDEDDLEKLFTDGVRSVVSGLPDEPDQYVPAEQPTARLLNLDGQLGGAAFLGGDGIASWRVEEVFTTSAGGQEIEVIADLATAGVAGEGNVGDANTDVVLGDVPLTNTGADDVTRTFRLVTEYPEPLLGITSSSLEADILIPGSGVGGGIDPFVLMGDLNQDDAINFADFLIFSANFGTTKDPIAPGTVPEPSSIMMLCFGGLLFGVLRRRRR